jgi:hypothetical protein
VIVAAKLEERNRDGRNGIMMRDLGARLPDVVPGQENRIEALRQGLDNAQNDGAALVAVM